MAEVLGLRSEALGAAVLFAVSAAAVVSVLVPIQTRLRDQIHPYTKRAAALLGVSSGRSKATGRSPREIVRALAVKAGRLVEGSTDSSLERKLAQAGALPGVVPAQRVVTYRTRVALTSSAAATVSLVGAAALHRRAGIALAFAALGFIAGASYWRGRLDRTIEMRRARMRIELYTINQILAMQIRVGRGVVAALRRLAEQGDGEIVQEVRDAMRLHRGGLSAAEALRRTAIRSPEPHARRTYRALATAEERGSDVAGALLAMSEDIRDGRRQAIRRRATRRRAVMLLPIIGLLAPVLLLFVAAPLPWLVLRGFG